MKLLHYTKLHPTIAFLGSSESCERYFGYQRLKRVLMPRVLMSVDIFRKYILPICKYQVKRDFQQINTGKMKVLALVFFITLSSFFIATSAKTTPLESCTFDTEHHQYNLAPLGGLSFNASVGEPGERFNIVFSVCGYNYRCLKYKELSGSEKKYQSCQLYEDKYVYQSGLPDRYTVTDNGNGVDITYSSDTFYSACIRRNKLSFTCDMHNEFQITSTSTPVACLFEIKISSRHACPV
ncbi:hypothetical protein CYY_008106 [Polysphondylium violaceum]|uniref:MRH domain-containing protein n=1 Tax=Polysphondylium violaceum TaxID=133409 RepID=A0A8J4UX79_9MYCE|nr:hypothetical protein CYY_008106 [Polysphondylium violaceum]